MNKLWTLVWIIGVGLSIVPETAWAAAADIVILPDCSFKLSVQTTADKSTLWRLWSDVEHWKKFDTLLTYSYLVENTKFETGAIGYLKAKGAPKTRFELIEVNQSVSFIESLKLPLFQTIELQRYFEVSDNGETIFTHEVNFKGGLRFIMYALLARTFKKELVKVMTNLKEVAESEELQQSVSGTQGIDDLLGTGPDQGIDRTDRL